MTGPTRTDVERTRDRVYAAIRAQLIGGAYRPGEKIKLRPLADALGTSITPVREALLQLVVAGALSHDRQHSVRVPILTADAYRELRDLRLMLECEVAEIATTTIKEQDIAELERLSLVLTPRPGLDIERYKADIARFHFTLYRAASRPAAVRLIEALWLQTGPYMNYLFPDYLKISVGPKQRGQICRAIRRRDAAAVRRAIETDLTTALSYIADRLETEQPDAAAA